MDTRLTLTSSWTNHVSSMGILYLAVLDKDRGILCHSARCRSKPSCLGTATPSKTASISKSQREAKNLSSSSRPSKARSHSKDPDVQVSACRCSTTPPRALGRPRWHRHSPRREHLPLPACSMSSLPPTLDSTCSCAPLSSPHTFKSLTRQCLCNLPSHRFLHACQQQYKDKPIHRYANRTREDGPRGLMPEYALAQRLLKTKRLSYMSDDLDLATTLK